MNINTLTIKAQEALQAALSLARERGQQAVEPLHLLAVLIREDDSLSTFLLGRVGVNVRSLRDEVGRAVASLPRVEGGGEQFFAQDTSKAIQRAVDFTKNFGDKYASVEHLLLALVAERGQAADILKRSGATEKELIEAIRTFRKGATVDSQTSEQQFDALGKYAINLNEQARSGKLDPVIGRDEEIRRVLQILSRRTKNNPILVGEAGVGKTAIAEGIAHRIVDGDVPETGLVYSMAIREVGGSMYDSYLKTYAGVDPNTGKSLWYVDPDNGDYSTTDVYDNARQARQGSTLAKVSGGFATSLSFYGVDISAQFAYQLGGKLYDNTYHELMHYGDNLGMNFHKDALKAWTPENPNTNVPRLNSSDDSNQKYSSRFLVSSDYLSVNNVTVGYTLPKKWSNKIGLGSIRIYFSGDNLAVFSAREGLDPRIVFGGTGTADNTSYSALRTISGGINLTF